MRALRRVDHILTRFDLWKENLPIWQAFQRLSAARGWAVGLTARPLGLAPSEVLAYATAHGCARTQEDLLEFEDLIYGMDSSYLKWWAEYQAEKTAKKDGK